MTRRVHLRIFQTTDLHGHLRPYDYYADSDTVDLGLAGLASALSAARSEVSNSLYFDCGDLIQGTPLSDVATATGAENPMVMALNALDCDAATLGNHDLDFGFSAMDRAYGPRAWPLVVSNLQRDDGTPVYQASALLKRDFVDQTGDTQTLKIGVIGTLPQQTTHWNGHHLKGHATITPALTAAETAANDLRGAGADLVIALAHSGLGDPEATADDENVGLAMAELAGVDLVLAGHTHVFAPPLVDVATAGPPVLQPGANGTHFGQCDLVLVQCNDDWEIESMQRRVCGPGPVASPVILSVSDKAHEETLAHIRQTIGVTAVPLCTHLNLIGYDGVAALTAEAMNWRAQQILPDRPCVAAIAPFRAGGFMGPDFYTNIPPGPLTLRHVADMYLYPNDLRLIEVTGAALRDWLDHAAGIYTQVSPGGAQQDLVRPDRPTYNADAIFGLSYTIDLAAPPAFDDDGQRNGNGSRIQDLRYQGVEIRPDARLIVATNSYRAGGGGGFHWLRDCPVFESPPELARDVLARYIQQNRQVTPDPRLPFRFSPLDGQEVRLFTSPNLSCDALGSRLRAGAVLANGFQEVILTL